MINIGTSIGNIRTEAEVFDTNGEVTDACSSEIPPLTVARERFAARKAIVKEF